MKRKPESPIKGHSKSSNNFTKGTPSHLSLWSNLVRFNVYLFITVFRLNLECLPIRFQSCHFYSNVMTGAGVDARISVRNVRRVDSVGPLDTEPTTSSDWTSTMEQHPNDGSSQASQSKLYTSPQSALQSVHPQHLDSAPTQTLHPTQDH